MTYPVVTVIIPVKNAASYIRQTVSDLEAQDYPALELLIVENGSSDETAKRAGEACEHFSQRQGRSGRLLRSEKDGVSAARNLGIANAQGKYVLFLDGDDRFEPNLVSALVRGIGDVGMVSCGYDTTIEDEGDSPIYASPEGNPRVLSRSDMISRLFFVTHYQGFVWNKMFRMEVIRRFYLRFHEDVFYNEDRTFVTEYLVHVKNARMLSDHLYHYIVHSSSAMGRAMTDQALAAEGTLSLEFEREHLHRFERRVTEIRGFFYMEKALRGFPKPLFYCRQDEAFSELRLFADILTSDKSLAKRYAHSDFRTYARRAPFLHFLASGKKEEALFRKLIAYGFTGSSYTPDPGWFFREDEV